MRSRPVEVDWPSASPTTIGTGQSPGPAPPGLASRDRIGGVGITPHPVSPVLISFANHYGPGGGNWTRIAQFFGRFRKIIDEHGPDAVAFYVSGQFLTEDYYVFNKLAKGLIGTNNIDTNSRLCMASAVAGYKQTLGADAPPACYEDLEHCDVLLIAGSNTAWAHPILYRRIEAAKTRNPALTIIVV